MERTAVRRRLNWQIATVADLVEETVRARSIVLDLPHWSAHPAGAHVDVRLTAEDGYQAQRSYSIASGPQDERLMLTVQRPDDGEVSPYLVDQLRVGDRLELRGPTGGYFVWEPGLGGPLQLIAAGAGLVPVRSMLRHRDAVDSTVPVRLLYSVGSLSEVIYREQLMRAAVRDGIDVTITLTRERPEGWPGYARRIDRDLLAEVCWPPTDDPRVYVCGSTAFAEKAVDSLLALGHDPGRIRTERFGRVGDS